MMTDSIIRSGITKDEYIASLEAEIARLTALNARKMEVAVLQPEADCPGLWIGFRTAADRDDAMSWFKEAHSSEADR